jgi:hypothetical protein
MKKRVMLAKIALLVVGCVGCGTADNSVEPGPRVSDQSEALLEVDLASDTEWTLSIDGGAPRPIKVPAGGYNSDRQDPPLIEMSVPTGFHDDPGHQMVKDHVLYQRTITVPRFGDRQAILVEFGAVNHGAEVFLVDGDSEILVTTHVGPLLPFNADLTHLVTPGKRYQLKVKAYTPWHYGHAVPVGFVYQEGWKEPEHGWASKFGFGITKYVRLAVYPEVRISDVFVQPSVSKASLAYDVWVRNHSKAARTVRVGAGLTSWNGDVWQYPALPETELTIPAESEEKVSIGPIAWTLGPDSYWWPNKPFREEYQARLHNLNLTLMEGESVLQRKGQRFGFVEWGEGPFYYLVNGVRINQVGDGTPESAMSEYDCYSVSPAFLPPTGPGTGCPETWKKYMRLGINTNRIHQSTPTRYMLEVADELGFMIIPETAIRGCQTQEWHDLHLPEAVRAMARFSRNHPSVCRYSLANEILPDWVPDMVDAIQLEDGTRPLVFHDNRLNRPARIKGRRTEAHAYAMMHYRAHPRPIEMITGLGEYAWRWDGHRQSGRDALFGNGGLEEFAWVGADMRRWDIAYMAGWDFINYWPNFLEGMSHQKHVWKQSSYPGDRVDGVDGWDSPVIRWLQKNFHPYLVMDVGVHEMNDAKSDLGRWPERTPSYAPGERIERRLEIFNDGLAGRDFVLEWEARWDSAQGPVVASGALRDMVIEPGFHKTVDLAFGAPKETTGNRKLFLVMKPKLQGAEVFREDDLYFTVQ